MRTQLKLYFDMILTVRLEKQYRIYVLQIHMLARIFERGFRKMNNI
jgi:hypothetical protein